jgi:hypothetical protein
MKNLLRLSLPFRLMALLLLAAAPAFALTIHPTIGDTRQGSTEELTPQRLASRLAAQNREQMHRWIRGQLTLSTQRMEITWRATTWYSSAIGQDQL